MFSPLKTRSIDEKLDRDTVLVLMLADLALLAMGNECGLFLSLDFITDAPMLTVPEGFDTLPHLPDWLRLFTLIRQLQKAGLPTQNQSLNVP